MGRPGQAGLEACLRDVELTPDGQARESQCLTNVSCRPFASEVSCGDSTSERPASPGEQLPGRRVKVGRPQPPNKAAAGGFATRAPATVPHGLESPGEELALNHSQLGRGLRAPVVGDSRASLAPRRLGPGGGGGLPWGAGAAAPTGSVLVAMHRWAARVWNRGRLAMWHRILCPGDQPATRLSKGSELLVWGRARSVGGCGLAQSTSVRTRGIMWCLLGKVCLWEAALLLLDRMTGAGRDSF